MAIQGYKEIIKDIYNTNFSPIYLIQGEEPYYIDFLASIFEKYALGEFEKEFNQTVLYGRDCEPLALTGLLKRYPMMANHQLVILKEAQEMKGGFNAKDDDKKESSKKDGKSDSLLNYMENPVPTTVFVICYKYKTIDKRSRLYKAIEKNGIVFESKKLYDNEIAGWIEDLLKEKSVKIEPRAAQMMADHIGNDLSRISNECEKLCINLKEGEVITTSHIETNIGISKEYNLFELQEAIGNHDITKAMRMVHYFKANPKQAALPQATALLSSYFNKLMLLHHSGLSNNTEISTLLKVNPFFVNQYKKAAANYSFKKLVDIAGYICEADLKSKGINSTGSDQQDLLKELVYKILH